MLQRMRPLNSVQNQTEDHDMLTCPMLGCKSNPGSAQRNNSELLIEFPWLMRMIAMWALKKEEVKVQSAGEGAPHHLKRTGFP